MENGGEVNKENFDLPSMLNRLVVVRYLEYTPQKTYGNVPPKDLESWPVDDNSVANSTNARDIIVGIAQKRPDLLPSIVDGLIKQGEDFNKFRFEPEKGTWGDRELSTRVVVETALKIGEPALPYLKGRKEDFAKKLETELKIQKSERFIKKIGSQVKSFLKGNT